MTGVLCAGLATVDLLLHVEDLPTRGEKYRAQDSALVTGGGATNAALAVARLGGEVALLARVGEDEFGGAILSALERGGVDARLVSRDPSRATPRSAVMIDAAGERMIVNFRDDGLFAAPPAPFAWVFDAALADTRWPDAAVAALSAARDAGAPGVIDAESPLVPASAALDLASHLAFSEQGLADYGDDPRAALEAAVSRHGGWACVTRGGGSVLVHDEAGFHEIPTYPVDVKDTLGAGDVWHGAFALFLGEGMGETEAVRHANAAAAIKCSGAGGMDAVPDRATLAAFLKEKTP